MPALGVAMSEGLLLQWLKSTGETVTAGEPIMEIETDKATVEVESPVAGVVGPLLFEAGAIVPVGTEMTYILEQDDAPGAVAATVADPSATAGQGNVPVPQQVPAGDAVPSSASGHPEGGGTPGQRMP